MPMSTTRTSPACRAPGSPWQAVEVRPRHAGEVVQRDRGDHVNLVTGFPEEAGRDQAVSPIVAGSDYDADGSPSGGLGRSRRQSRPGFLGEFQFQDATPLHREAIRRAHLVRIVESVEPSGQRSPCPLFLHVPPLPQSIRLLKPLILLRRQATLSGLGATSSGNERGATCSPTRSPRPSVAPSGRRAGPGTRR